MSHVQSRKGKTGGKGGKDKSTGKSKSKVGQPSPTVDDPLTSPGIERYLTRDTAKEKSPPKRSDTTKPSSREKGEGTPTSSTKEAKITDSRPEQSSPRAKPRTPISSARSTRGGQRGRKKKPAPSVKDSDGDYAPTARRRQVQQSIKDLFPVRRSTRRPKALLESEQFEYLAQRLRNKNEEGLTVVDVEGKGRGVVSSRPFRKGELICEYSGELISYKEAQRREEQYSEDHSIGCYMYYFSFKGKRLCVDATKDNGRMGRLLNHSKTLANVVTRLVEVDGHPYLCLMAAREIRVGEELVYDYGERSREAMDSHPWLAT